MNQPTIYVLGAAVMLASCSPKFYVPNTQNVPLIREKGEVDLTLSGNGNQVEFQGAYGVSNAFAVQLNGGAFIPSDLDNGNGGSGKFVEVGGGVFKQLSDHVVFETYGIVGLGSFENHLPSTIADSPLTTGDISASFIRLGVQPNLGYRSKYFTAAISSRFSNVSYNNLRGALYFDGKDQVAYLNANKSNFFIEPALTLRGGSEKIKLQVQYVYSVNASNSDFPRDDSMFTVGLGLHF